MADFAKAYKAEWKLMSVDQDTWDDSEQVSGVASASINRDATDSIPLLETASFEIDTDVTSEFEEGWYRLVMDVVQDMSVERYAISTVLLAKSDDLLSYNRDTSTISGYSVLKPLMDIKNTGENYRYAPKGINGADWVSDIIRASSPAPVHVDGTGFTLDDNIVFSPGVSYLQMIWNVLDKQKWCMTIDGNGTITILERPKESTFTSDYIHPLGFHPDVKRSSDTSEVPNRYIAIDRDGSREVVENHNASSRLSYERRGRWVDYVDTNPVKTNGETLYAYSRRRMEEESTILKAYAYNREYVPGMLPFHMVSLQQPKYNIDGDLRIMSQAITCGVGITVSETAGLEIKEWTA